MSVMALDVVKTTMTTFLTTIGEFFTQCMTWLSNVLDVIVANPALTILCLAMPIVGFAVGLLSRLIRV